MHLHPRAEGREPLLDGSHDKHTLMRYSHRNLDSPVGNHKKSSVYRHSRSLHDRRASAQSSPLRMYELTENVKNASLQPTRQLAGHLS